MKDYIYKEAPVIYHDRIKIHHDGNYLELFITLVAHIMSKYNERNFDELHLLLSINDEGYSFHETVEQDEEDWPSMVLGFIKYIVSDISGEDLDKVSKRRRSELYSEENCSVANLVFITWPKSAY